MSETYRYFFFIETQHQEIIVKVEFLCVVIMALYQCIPVVIYTFDETPFVHH